MHKAMRPSLNPEARRERTSDWVGFACFAGWAVINGGMGVSVFLRTPAIAVFLIPTFLHDSLIAASFLCRKPLRQQAEGWMPRLAAYTASVIVPAFAFIAGRWQPGWIAPSSRPLYMAGTIFWICGAYFGVWALFRLRHAFSIVPQARVLVTSGPYRLARHPVYASYLLQYAGLALSHLTPISASVLAVWWCMAMARMSYEESVLSAEFPEYETYRSMVGRFMPRLIRRAHWPHMDAKPAAQPSLRASGTDSGYAAR